MNEFYSRDTSNKIKAIFRARMQDGKRCSGSVPYGYVRSPSDKQTLVVDPRPPRWCGRSSTWPARVWDLPRSRTSSANQRF